MSERPAATGRGVELGLLVFAAGLVTLALVLVEAEQKQQLSRSLLDLANAAAAMDAGEPVPAADASRQVAWTAVALVLFVAVLWRVRDHRSLASCGYTLGLVGLGLLVLPGVLPASI